MRLVRLLLITTTAASLALWAGMCWQLSGPASPEHFEDARGDDLDVLRAERMARLRLWDVTLLALADGDLSLAEARERYLTLFPPDGGRPDAEGLLHFVIQSVEERLAADPDRARLAAARLEVELCGLLAGELQSADIGHE